MATALVNFLWLPNIRQHRYFNLPRTQSVAHKSGRWFFGIDVRGIRTSSQDDAKKGYNLEGREIMNVTRED